MFTFERDFPDFTDCNFVRDDMGDTPLFIFNLMGFAVYAFLVLRPFKVQAGCTGNYKHRQKFTACHPRLIPGNFVAIPPQHPPPFLLRLSQLRIPRLNLISRGFTHFIPEKIPFLNHKIPVLPNFPAIMPLHSLVKRKTVLSNAAFGTVAR